MPTLADVAAFLDELLAAARYPGDENGIYLPSQTLVARLGLALEPLSGLAAWVQQEELDALFLHRPWRLAPEALPAEVGVLAYHLAFDEGLTLGMNPWLAEELGMSGLEPLGKKEGRTIGMLGRVPPAPFARVKTTVEGVFGGLEGALPNRGGEVARLAVVGAMSAALVEEAAVRGADLYVTGQFRPAARRAALETGVGVLEVGHARSERWGLTVLAKLLRERFAGLEVVLAPEDSLPRALD